MLIGITILFQSCEPETMSLNEEPLTTVNATIERSSLVGHWDLSVMKADTEVDLNGDGVGNTNLLEETDCFNTMDVTFNDDGTMTTTNSRLDFRAGENNDEFACLSDRQDVGTWNVEGEELVLVMEINGELYEDRKLIVQEENTFSFDIEKWESEQYVTDPGDTHVSGITILSLSYTKVE